MFTSTKNGKIIILDTHVMSVPDRQGVLQGCTRNWLDIRILKILQIPSLKGFVSVFIDAPAVRWCLVG